jgi:fluoride ion exporter CrcB/FEX
MTAPALVDLASSNALGFFVTTILPVWLIGLVTGLLVPRHAPVLSDVRAFLGSGFVGAVSMGTNSTTLSQFMMFVNGAMFVQSLWYGWTEPGTFHSLCGRVGQLFGVTEAKRKEEELIPVVQRAGSVTKAWYIDEGDLKFFRSRVEQEGGVLNAGPFETMIEKDIPGLLKYQSQRRMLKDIKKTEYLTTSITADSTPHEVRCRLKLLGQLRTSALPQHSRRARLCPVTRPQTLHQHAFLVTSSFCCTCPWALVLHLRVGGVRTSPQPHNHRVLPGAGDGLLLERPRATALGQPADHG